MSGKKPGKLNGVVRLVEMERQEIGGGVSVERRGNLGVSGTRNKEGL